MTTSPLAAMPNRMVSPRNLPMSARLVTAVNAPVVAVLRHPWVESIVRVSAMEDVMATLHPMLSLTEVRARVVRIVNETPTTKTFVLQPNALWQGARAGQFVKVRVEIDGRRVERVYSLSSRPGARRLAITVKRQDGGLMSNYLHRAVGVGQVLTIGQADGDFVLPEQLPAKMLLLSAGSGITPVMSMLRDLQARAYQGDVVFLHVCRSPEELIFSRQLYTIASAFVQMKLLVHVDQVDGAFSVAQLARSVPDLGERSTWLCGPGGLMDNVHRYWEAQAIAAPLYSERFVAAPMLPAEPLGTPVAITFVHSGKTFLTCGVDPLLVQAQRAGLSPKHGCKIGICRSCQCTKASGTVQNMQTGEISSAPDELIRLCISSARSDVKLAL
jgi:stearoyl-CoA 9-desaturase NADPH oxidoreductase